MQRKEILYLLGLTLFLTSGCLTAHVTPYEPYPYDQSVNTDNNPQPNPSISGNPNTIGVLENNTFISSETITKDGYRGSYLNTLNKVALPLALSYASDVKLKSSSGGSDRYGETPQRNYPPFFPDIIANTAPPFYEWRFYFISSEKKETYTIRVNFKSTIITKEKWQNNNFGTVGFDHNEIKLDSTDIYKIFEKYIEDKDFIANKIEDKDAYSINEFYNLPAERDYSFIVEQQGDNIIWKIRSSDMSDPSFEVPPSKDFKPGYTYSSLSYEAANASIDAKTGKIITLFRPTVLTYK